MTRLITALTMLAMTGLVAAATIGLAIAGRGNDPEHQATAAARAAVDGPIHVRVVDIQGKAAAGIAVEVCREGERPRPFPTAAGGRATIPRDVLGEWAVLLARRGHEALAWGVVGDVSQVRPAGTVDDPIVMMLLPLDHRVEGSVVDLASQPIAGVEMQVEFLNHPTNGACGLKASDAAIAPVVTDRAGRFVVLLPRDSRAGFKARHPRYLGGAGAEARDATIGPYILEPAGGIAGRVIDAATGKPVAGAVLNAELIEHHARILGGGWGEAVSDDQGRFLIGGLEPGVFNVVLRKVPGRAQATAPAAEAVRVRVGADASADLTVVEGRPLQGVVVDRETGRPVPGIELGCFGPARPRSWHVEMKAKTDREGRFTFHVPPGEQYVYLIDGSRSNRLDHRYVVVPERGDIEPVRLVSWLKPIRNPTMEYAKARVPDVKKVTAPPPTEPARAKIADMVKAEAHQKASEPAEAKVRIAEDARAAPAAPPEVRTVTGHVRDPQGRPIAGVRVGIRPDMVGPDLRPQRYDVPTTDREGLFILPAMPRRPLKIALTRPGYRWREEEIPADRDEVQWTFSLVPDASVSNQSAQPSDEPIPPGLRDRLTFVDLDPWGTDYLSDGPDQGGNDLNRLLRGIHKLGETYFRIGEKMVHVQGRGRPDLPRSVKGIKVRTRGRVLHFLHATGGGDSDGRLIGAYVIHYADGSMETIPIAYGRDITNWWHRDPGRPISRARAAWTGLNDAVERHTRPGLMVRLFDMTWTNPHPDREITSLDMLSTGKDCDPFLVAVTLQAGE